MGHKVHPVGFRLGISRGWQAKWFAPDKEYAKLLHEDIHMRRLLLGRLKNAGISRIETERSANQLTVTVFTAKPGIVIGKGGASVDQLRDELERISGKKVRVTIQEIKRPELDAKLVAENVAMQLEKRIAFRRAIKQSLLRTMRAGAQGVKIRVKGRLGGSEMARIAWDREGRVPLHTLDASIDFGQTEAITTFGRIGVSVWLYDRVQPVVPPPAEEVAPVEAPERVVAAPLAEPPPAVVPPIPSALPAVAAPTAGQPVAAGPAPAEAPARPRAARRRTPKAEPAAEAKVPRKRAAPRVGEEAKKPARAKASKGEATPEKAPPRARAPRKKPISKEKG